jgi:hypothetical protein
MTPIEEAIVKRLQQSGPCSLDDVVTHLSSFSSGEIFIALIGCRGTDACCFTNAGTQRISSHLARSLPIQAPLYDEGRSGSWRGNPTPEV